MEKTVLNGADQIPVAVNTSPKGILIGQGPCGSGEVPHRTPQ